MSYEKAAKIVCDEINKDVGLRQAFQANIAMAFVDNADWYKKRHNKKSLSRKDLFNIANEAANYFLDQWTK